MSYLRSWTRLALATTSIIGAATIANPAKAQTTNWVGGTGSWFVPGNWDAGVPTGATTTTEVAPAGGTAQIAGQAANAGSTLLITNSGTVDLQTGGSLTAGAINVVSSGTLLLSGSTAVTGPVTLSGGTVLSTTTGTLSSDLTFAGNVTNTVSAAAGQTLTLSPANVTVGDANPATLHFGSATDTGVVVVGPITSSVTVSGSNSTIEVVGGTLRNGNGFALGALTSSLASTTVDSGATLDLNGHDMTVNGLKGSGTVTTGGAQLELNGNLNDFGGAITGTGKLLVTNASSVSLTGTNTYTGGTVIGTGGDIALHDGGSLVGSVVNGGGLNIDLGGTLNLSGSLTSGAGGSGTSINNGTLHAISDGTVSDKVLFIEASTDKLSAAAGKTLTFAPTTIQFGVGGDTQPVKLVFGSATDTGVVVVGPIGTLIQNVTPSFEVAGGTLRAVDGSLKGLLDNSSSMTVDAGATLDLNGFNLKVTNLQGSGTVATGGGHLELFGGANFGGSITGTGGLLVSSSVVILTGTNTFTGGTVITAGTALLLNPGGSITGSVANDGTFEIAASATFNLSGTLTSGTVSSTTLLDGGTLRSISNSTVTDNITFGSGFTSTVSAAAGQTLTLTPASMTLGLGSAAHAIFGSATDTGVVVFGPFIDRSIDQSSTIEVAGGTLKAGSGVLGAFTSDIASTKVDAGATLDLNGFDTEVKSLLGSGTVATGGAQLIFGSGGSNFGGSITGTGSLAVTGTTVNILTGTNTFTGGTSIDNGAALALILGGSIVGSVDNSGTFAIDVGGTFNLSGALTSGNVASQTQFNGGTLRATSNSAVTDNVTFSGGFTNTVSAAAGQTLLFEPDSLTVDPGAGVRFGSATDTGVVVFAPGPETVGANVTVEIAGGTLQNGNGGLSFLTHNATTTTVDAGATLDLNGFGMDIKSLQGSGTVMTSGAELDLVGGASNFAGAITGTGSLVINLGATAVLTGTNTYTGGTRIETGTSLTLGNGGATGSIVGNVADNGIFAVNRSNALTLDGVISGNGVFNQIGPGTTTLTAVNTYTGLTSVTAGELVIAAGGSIVSNTTVSGSGTLGGSGTVAGVTVDNGGTFAPGSLTQGLSMTVAGNLAFQSGAFYLVQFGLAGNTSAKVTGSAALNGTAEAVFTPASLVAKQNTILTSAGGLNGTTFASLVTAGLPSNVAASLSYDAHDVFLNLALSPVSPNGPLNGNQQNVANALAAFFNSGGALPLFLAAFNPAILSQASGELATASQQTTFDAMSLFTGLLTDPFVAGRGDGLSAGGASANGYASTQKSGAVRDANAMFTKALPPVASFEQRWSVWAAGYGGSQTTDGNATAGSNSVTSRIFGTAVGADYRFSPSTIAGFALAGGGTNFSVVNNGTGRSDLFQAGAFIRHNEGPAYISAALAYGWQDITTDRTVTILGIDKLHAEFNANAWSGRLEGGYRFVAPIVGGVGITPYAAGQATTFDLPGYAERALVGSNAFALAYGSKNVTDTRSELGFRADKSFAMADGIFTLRGRTAWAHDFDPDRNIGATFQTLPGASFVVNGAMQAANSALVTASAEKKWLSGWSAAATFEGEFSNVTRSYAGKGVVRYAW